MPPRPPKPEAPPRPRPPALPKRFALTADHYSHFTDKKGKQVVYGRKGDTVTLISEWGEMYAVQAANGDKYPIPKHKLIPL